ncbi:MAG: HAMP domain-containing sensor histidine kinase, partial [Christensenella sp.]
LEQISIEETMEQVDLSEVARDVLRLLEDGIKKRNITVTLTGTAEINANRNRMRELIMNLCDNAVKYNKMDGRVDVSLKDDGEFVYIIVKDTGIGVPKEDIARVFERFYRAKNSGGSTVNGTGLGLAIVKHIAALYDGELVMKSELGEGSEFSVKLKKM